MEFSVKIEGVEELERALNALGPVPARKVGAKALKTGGEIIADHARILVPVRTGKLEESITVVTEKATRDDERKGAIGFRPPASRYAHLVEFGTTHSIAQPFMRPAIDASGEDAIAVIGHELWAGIAAEAAKVA